MRFLKTLAFAGIILALASCDQKGGSGEATTPSGFKYTLHTNGDGQKPNVGDYVLFHIRQMKGDEVMFDSRKSGEDQIVQISEGKKDNPIEDVLAILTEGDSATVEVVIDTVPDLPPDLQGVKSLTFHIKINDVKTEEEFQAFQEEKMAEMKAEAEKFQVREEEVAAMVKETVNKYNNGELKDQLQDTQFGLKYIIHEEGTGPMPTPGQQVKVAYYGVLKDGTMFDNSFKRGEPLKFPIGQGRVIPGWDYGIPLFKEGTKATLFIPSDLGYGTEGSPPNIPGDSELIFYIELIEVI
jgi:FKBP-type peptidyl-prolyl cis-trans isomerase FkpA